MKKIYSLLLISLLGFYFSSAQTELWGLASLGGVDSAGTIFKMGLDGSNFTPVFSFDSATGFSPPGSLIQANNTMFYGLTYGGGVEGVGAGTIFSYDPSTNTYITVYEFDYSNTGSAPENSLSSYSGNHKLYGMTSDGGPNGGGVIFSFDPDSNLFAKLYDFTDTGGWNPYGNLVEGPGGKFYGLTSRGGGPDSIGSLFSFDITNNTFSNLHNFSDATGGTPDGSLTVLSGGLLYGMTSQGGTNGVGVIFSFNLNDSIYLDLYNFNDTSGAYPYGSLIQASDSLLYGMASGGGASDNGVIFNFNPFNNAYSDLSDFGGINGATPAADLVQASDNKMYGTTEFGGVNDSGVVFSFDPSNSSNPAVDLLDFNGTNGQYPTGSLIEVITTGIHELSNNTDVQLYPNPANEELMISIKTSSAASGIEKMDIYNLVGEKIYTEAFPSSGLMSQTTIDVSDLSAGVYFVHLQQADGSWVGKFVKE